MQIYSTTKMFLLDPSFLDRFPFWLFYLVELSWLHKIYTEFWNFTLLINYNLCKFIHNSPTILSFPVTNIHVNKHMLPTYLQINLLFTQISAIPETYTSGGDVYYAPRHLLIHLFRIVNDSILSLSVSKDFAVDCSWWIEAIFFIVSPLL